MYPLLQDFGNPEATLVYRCVNFKTTNQLVAKLKAMQPVLELAVLPDAHLPTARWQINCSCILVPIYTLENYHVEPKNGGLEDNFPFQLGVLGSTSVFRSVRLYKVFVCECMSMCLPKYQHHQRSGTRETRDSLPWRATAPYKYMLFRKQPLKTTVITNPRWKVSSFQWINNLVEDLSQVHDC